MDFDLSKPQKLLKETARQFLSREHSWEAMADQGWMGFVLPDELVELAVVMEERGRACAGGPFLANVFATALISTAGSAEQKSRWLEPIASGQMKATVAMGRQFVLDADTADLIFAITPDGAAVATPTAITPMRSMDEGRKFFDVVLEPGEPLPGDRAAVQRAVDIATVALCAEMVGGMQWILDTTVEYAKTRQQFGRPIGSFQAVQHHCADMLLLTESARSAAYFAAWEPAPLAASIAKAYCSDAFREVGNRGIQVHGGIGFTWEHDLHLYYKRAKSSETMFGDATFHRERIASLVVDEAQLESALETSPDHRTVRA